MSYILDALKKAESERKLGSVPNIHAQPVPVASLDDRVGFRPRPLVWIVLMALILLLGAIAWLKPWQSAPISVLAAPSPAAMQQPSTATPMMDAPPPAVSAVAAPPAPVANVAGPGTAPPAADPAPSQEAVSAAPPKPKTPKPVKKPKESKPPQPAASADAQSAKKPEPGPVKATPVATRVATLRELPENIQREIPMLTIGGYIYAANPTERSVLINNRLLREGDQVVPGLTLEQMMPKEVVLNYRGYRYRVSY